MGRKLKAMADVVFQDVASRMARLLLAARSCCGPIFYLTHSFPFSTIAPLVHLLARQDVFVYLLSMALMLFRIRNTLMCFPHARRHEDACKGDREVRWTLS